MNDCFAIQIKKGKLECNALKEIAFREYQRTDACGNYGCPFYKPKGFERAVVRGLTDRIVE